MPALDTIKFILLWIGWISITLFVILALISYISSKSIKKELDELNAN